MKALLGWSVVDQALVSAFNFALNLYLIKLWAPKEFGFFAIVAATSIFVAMIQNALINTPLAVHLPATPDEGEKALLRRVFSAVNALLALLVLVLALGSLLAWMGSSQWAPALGASLYMSTQFVREYYRAFLAVEGRLRALMLMDLAYVAFSAGALAYLHWLGRGSMQTVPAFLLVLSAVGLLTVLPCLVPRHLPSLRRLPGEIAAVFAGQMHEIRWSLLGVITTDIQNRGYIFVAASVFGPVAVAHLQAGRIFFGPLNLLTGAWARVARPQLARFIGQGDVTAFRTVLTRALWVFIAFNALFLASLWVAWPYLSAFVFGDKYEGLEYLVCGWGLANIAFQIRSCLSTGVQALRHFRELTLATICGALLSVAIVVVACLAQASAWFIASVLGGECMAIVIVVRILRQCVDAPAPTVRKTSTRIASLRSEMPAP